MNRRWPMLTSIFDEDEYVKELAKPPRPDQIVFDLKMYGLQPETEESRAQRMAKEIRDNNPSMQVQRRTRREA